LITMFDGKDLLNKMFDGGGGKPGYDAGYDKGGYDKGGYGKQGYGKPGYDPSYDQGGYDKKAAYEKEAWAKKAGGGDDAIAEKKEAWLKSQGQGGGQGSSWGAPAAGGIAAAGGGFLSGLAGLFGGGNTAPASPSVGNRFGSHAAEVGGLALIGGLAYAAYRAYSNRNQGGAAAAPAPAAAAPAPSPAAVAPPPPNSGFTPPAQDADAQHALGVLLIRAMISAAKSDGQIDAQETQRIFGEMNTQSLSQAEKAFLMEEIGKPIDVDTLASQAQTPQIATQVYAASVMVIDAESPQETQYLQTLAQKLHIDAPLAAEIHQQVQAATPRPAQ
jgi:uncharacterized membrane protein YebE (DUF533 family)